ncbi:hypothetical protein FA15DRAFT_650474 [Coprinopsis marcescibilis]|uniref:G domain-containing protein n=1 Tax=Coprinopsis marcescibilis TaxID=230819 RepID=A0A5C3KBG9_COPMA|nr:hypothetical protein FA15DRAFT_650474 [Coprinopsis marcescibilis]
MQLPSDPRNHHDPPSTFQSSRSTGAGQDSSLPLNVAQGPSEPIDNNPPNVSTPVILATEPPLKSEPGLIADHCDTEQVRNVVVFGETGVGKSSIINMLARGDSPVAEVSSGVVGCTFASAAYRTEIEGEKYILWDTAGLNEGYTGTVNSREAAQNLQELSNRLDGRINLLVYCIRGKRLRQVIMDNYDLFYNRICRRNVPIVLVVTGLENEPGDMDIWWQRNAQEFTDYGMDFTGYACITATRGKAIKGEDGRFMFDEEYKNSCTKLLTVVKTHCANSDHRITDFPGNILPSGPGNDVDSGCWTTMVSNVKAFLLGLIPSSVRSDLLAQY